VLEPSGARPCREWHPSGGFPGLVFRFPLGMEAPSFPSGPKWHMFLRFSPLVTLFPPPFGFLCFLVHLCSFPRMLSKSCGVTCCILTASLWVGTAGLSGAGRGGDAVSKVIIPS
jgi:hypothetical protein